MSPDLSLIPKAALQKLADDIERALKNVRAEYQDLEYRLSESGATLTWEDRTVKRQILANWQMQISNLRTELDQIRQALKERRPAIVRVFLDDLALGEPCGPV